MLSDLRATLFRQPVVATVLKQPVGRHRAQATHGSAHGDHATRGSPPCL